MTITTVGYGDIAPESALGRMCVCIFILMAIVIVPLRVNTVLEYLALSSPYAGHYHNSQSKKHIIVTGIFDPRSTTAPLQIGLGPQVCALRTRRAEANGRDMGKEVGFRFRGAAPLSAASRLAGRLRAATHGRDHRGSSGSDLTPRPPRRSKTLRRSGPHLAPTSRQRRRKRFFSIRWGVQLRFYPLPVHLKCSAFQGVSKYVYKI